MLAVVTPADDPNLFTVADARAMVGLASDDASKDDVLAPLAERVSADVYAACRIKRATGASRTLRKERVRETKLFQGGDRITLSRRHDINLVSLSVAGAAQDVTDYLVDGDSGLVTKIVAGQFEAFVSGLVVAVYDAGFEDVPADLLGAAADLLRVFYAVDVRDPLIKSERIKVEGIDEVETQYFAGSASASVVTGLPTDIMARLTPYRNAVYA